MTCDRCARDLDTDSAFCRYCGTAVGASPHRRLTRVPARGRIAGVCAGLADYSGTDVTVVRLAWVILSLVPGAVVGGIVAYVAAWLIMPESPAPPRTAYAGKRLVRSGSDRKLAGVCGGVAEYLDVDPTLVRVLAVVLAIYPGAVVGGAIVYVVAWVIMPEAPELPAASVPSTV